MALTGLEIHHHAVRMRPDAVAETRAFYEDVLGLSPDPGVREIPGVPLFWMDTGNDTQIHLFGVEGVSRYARRPDRDPFTSHVAFGVPDILQARTELDRLHVEYWSVGRDKRQQIFLYDQADNMIELHQIDTCRCRQSTRPAPGGPAID
ncbi:VOC family protein [Parafrankia elaeagni]|uniref:VOC family protein n=1 Tax=Parafrankia elaeagni TaxID=222534 RepID=UPI000372FE0B|nr:VOC family protein [Parafrankia elaeagni]